jgi:hypothetical protein
MVFHSVFVDYFFSSPPVEKIAKAEFFQMFIQFHGCIYLAQGEFLRSNLNYTLKHFVNNWTQISNIKNL